MNILVKSVSLCDLNMVYYILYIYMDHPVCQ